MLAIKQDIFRRGDQDIIGSIVGAWGLGEDVLRVKKQEKEKKQHPARSSLNSSVFQVTKSEGAEMTAREVCPNQPSFLVLTFLCKLFDDSLMAGTGFRISHHHDDAYSLLHEIMEFVEWPVLVTENLLILGAQATQMEFHVDHGGDCRPQTFMIGNHICKM
jgi:hypothetical protein